MTLEINITIEEIAQIIDGQILGTCSHNITGLNRIEHAAKQELTFISDEKFLPQLDSTNASCILISKKFNPKEKEGKAIIIVEDAYQALAKLLSCFSDKIEKKSSAIHPSAVVDPSATIADSAYVGPYCVIGKNCTVGDNAILHSHVVLYDDCVIGTNTVIHSHVLCCRATVTGKNCLINGGAVLGGEGFGFLEDKATGEYKKIPQLGNVVLGDNVEIGANTTIDRALIGSTIVGNGVKLDNLVQLGHNVEIGENTALASQTGISGSTKIGKRNRFGGQVGLSGHITTADDVVIYAKSGVANNIKKAGIYFGIPIKDRLTAFKIEAVLRNLPELFGDVRKIKKLLEKDSK